MDLIRELRQAARQLVSVPSFTIPAVLLLGLGLGAAIAMFSVVHAVLLRPMVPEQDRVVVLFPLDPQDDRPFQEISPPEFRDWRNAATSFQELAAFSAGSSEQSLLLDERPRGRLSRHLGHPKFLRGRGAEASTRARLREGRRAAERRARPGLEPRPLERRLRRRPSRTWNDAPPRRSRRGRVHRHRGDAARLRFSEPDARLDGVAPGRTHRRPWLAVSADCRAARAWSHPRGRSRGNGDCRRANSRSDRDETCSRAAGSKWCRFSSSSSARARRESS